MLSNAASMRLSSKDRSRLWAGLLLAPGAWAIMEGIGYVLASRGCTPGPAGIPIYGPSRPALVEIWLGVALAVAAVVGLVTAIRSVERAGDESDDPPFGRARFMAQAGVISSALFVLGIIFSALPSLFVNACSRVR